MPRKRAFRVTRAGPRVAVIRRDFAAPRAEVFAALTRADLIRRWMVAADRRMTACEVDLRAGGSYRYEFEGPGGRRFVMHGAYREVVPGSRIVHEESYEGSDWPPLVSTTTLTENAGVTSAEIRVEYPSREICDEDFPNLAHGADGWARMERVLVEGRKKGGG